MGEVLIVLQWNRFTRSSAAALRAGSRINAKFSARRVARLCDEIIDHPMEKDAVIESGLHVGDHVVRGDGCPLFEQFDDDRPFFSLSEVGFHVRDVHLNDGVARVGGHHGGILGFGAVRPFGRVKADAAPFRLLILGDNGERSGERQQQEHHQRCGGVRLATHALGWTSPP